MSATASRSPGIAPQPDDVVPAGTEPDSAGDAVMADDAAGTSDGDTRKPQSMRFRRRYTTVRLTPEQAGRQGQVATSAFKAFGGRDAAVAFLNGHDDALGGRPLDLAVASAEGLAAVEQALAGHAARR